MKTLEEVKGHIYEVGYTEKAIERICGFLIGKELKRENELLRFCKGENEFSDFLNWFKDSSTDYFRRKDVEKNEVYGNIKIEPIPVSINVVYDNIFEEILKEIGFKKEEKPKYKYTGEKREELKKDKKTLINIIESNENYLKHEDIYNSPYDFIINFSNAQCKAKLNDIERKLNETVD